MRLSFFAAAILLPVCGALADDCIEYKVRPRVDIATYDAQIKISQPENFLEEHGHVQTSLRQESAINVSIQSVHGGWCVILTSVDTKIGYEEFDVKVDKKYKPDSCFYNAVLAHEKKHINTYKSVLDNHKKDLHDTFYSAADSIMPVFIDDIENINDVVDNIGNQLNTHPDVVLIVQKINGELEIKNKKIDADEDGADMNKCLTDILKK